MSKYQIPVTIITCASHTIGYVMCDSVDEYYEKAEALWEKHENYYPSNSLSNEFDLGDWDIMDVVDEDLKYYENSKQ